MQPFIPSEADMIKDGPQPALQPMGDGTRARSASMETRPGNFPGFDGEDAELAAALALSLMNSEPASQPAGMLCLNISLFGDCSAYLIDFKLKLCRPRRTWQVIPRRQMKSNAEAHLRRESAESTVETANSQIDTAREEASASQAPTADIQAAQHAAQEHPVQPQSDIDASAASQDDPILHPTILYPTSGSAFSAKLPGLDQFSQATEVRLASCA